MDWIILFTAILVVGLLCFSAILLKSGKIVLSIMVALVAGVGIGFIIFRSLALSYGG